MFYKNYRAALHPRQVFLCKRHYTTIFEMVEIETDLVWLPRSNSLLAFFKIGSKIHKSDCRSAESSQGFLVMGEGGETSNIK
jgi:hypothetical protein